MKKFCIVVFLLIMGFKGITQQQAVVPLKKFSEDKDKYLQELTTLMEQDDKKMAEEFLAIFTPFWNSSQVTDDYRFSVYTLSNMMLKKKLKPFPHFKEFLEAFAAMVKANRPLEEYFSWHDGASNLLTRTSMKYFFNFIEMTSSLLKDNTIYKSNTTQWKADNNSFVFKYDSVAKVEFSQVTLTCNKYGDSTMIFGTKGIYVPYENIWYGEGGSLNWQRVGQSLDSMYADLGKYQIEMKSSDFKADSVQMHYLKFFSEPLLGQLEEKIQADKTAETANYPKFTSYSKRHYIKDIFPNIDYDGGLVISGSRFYAKGTPAEKARILFNRDSSGLFIMAQAESFVIKKDRISSDNAEISIYLDKDSIYHPMAELRFLYQKKNVSRDGMLSYKDELTIQRGDKGVASSPFFDSYHMVDMFVEAIYWNLGEPLMKFAMFKGVKTESESTFESDAFFTVNRYDRIQGLATEHPFETIKKYATKVKSNKFRLNDLANYMKMDYNDMESFIVLLANRSFVSYDFDNKIVTVRNRMYHYLNARYGKTDYDIIQINSSVSIQQFDHNASLNLLNNEITIEGVPQVNLSDSHNVVIYPYELRVFLRKNRDFDFQGKIQAGLFEFYGKDFNFIYDDFKINMNNVDSFTFYVPGSEIDPETGEPQLMRIRTMIEGVTGELLIDNPNNKSGLKPFRNYPIFNSKKDSYAYYDRPSIYGGVYNRENFFYQLEPFSFDSLDKFSTSGIAFNGYFASAGIFPDFDDDLTVMPDYSLGFSRKTPADGFPVYEGKGKYSGTIALSNEGLHGDGEIKYITSTSLSKDFVYFPDSTNAEVYDFKIEEVEKEEPQYPPVTGLNVQMHWIPYDDLMQDSKITTPMNFYNNACVLHGRSDLTPTGLSGTGKIEFPTAEIDALLFQFKHHEFDSDTCNFTLKANDQSGDAALATVDYNGHVNLKEQKAHFKANSDASKVEFPINQYVCFMDEFIWYMDKGEIELFTSKDTKLSGDDKQITLNDGTTYQLSGSEFVSVHPAQDSLRFYSPRAKYDVAKNIINASDVLFMFVADAAIFPDSGKVTVMKKAVMKTLENSRIVANTATKYHLFYDTKVNVYGRKSYGASGYYDYIDENEKKQQIYFDKIAVDSTYQTFAQGIIPEEKKFTLSPFYEYNGKVNLRASNQKLNFNGNTRIKHSCASLPINWLHFDAEIDPLEIYIPVSEKPKDQNNASIFAGVIQGVDSIAVYSTFLSRKLKFGDDTLMSVSGYLYYDKEVKEYRIADMARIKENKFTGNYLSLNSYCDVYGEGKMMMSSNLGQVKLNTYGSILDKTKKDEKSLDVVVALDFFFSDKAMKIIEETFSADVTAVPSNLNSEIYYKALVDKLGQAQADKMISDLNINGAFKKLPDELVHTFFMTDLQLKWNKEKDSYQSIGGQIGFGNMNKSQLNKKFKSYFEIHKRKSGDVMSLYIEDAQKNWFFFTYTRGIMQVLSSNKEFNLMINDMKTDDRTLKTEKGQQPYTYQTSSDKKKSDFLRSMGIDE